MDLLGQLTDKDRNTIYTYLSYYGGADNCGDYPCSDLDYFLRYWASAKFNLYKMFGNQFIIKRPISFDRRPEELADEMYHQLSIGMIRVFRRNFYNAMHSLVGLTESDRYNLTRLVDDMDMLASNTYDGPSIVIPAQNTVNGRPLHINRGSKAVKMVGKIVEALDLNQDVYECPVCGHTTTDPEWDKCCDTKRIKITAYEKFRRAHSLALNQKTIRGELCLSIHPMDYITMSDNNCGWESCMQWMEDSGDFRLGTIEMMNSEYIVVAYVESNDYLEFGSCEWNSKRWRQLVIVTPELLLGNRQYPFNNDFLQGTVLQWMKDLAHTNPSYGPYMSEAVNIVNRSLNTIGKRKIDVNLNFAYMYNDIYGDRLGFIKMNFEESYIYRNLSGPAVCTCCGGDIYPDEVDPSWTICRECSGMYRCDECGSWYNEMDMYHTDRGSYCSYCYHHHLEECEICGDRDKSCYMSKLFVQINPTDESASENWSYYIVSCEDCLGSEQFIKLFGPSAQASDQWGIMRNIILLDNISEQGFEKGDLNSDVVIMLKQLQDTPIEDRAALIEKIFY